MWLKLFEYMSFIKSIIPLGMSFSSKIFQISHKFKLSNAFYRSTKHIYASLLNFNYKLWVWFQLVTLLNSKAFSAICFTIKTASIQDPPVLNPLHIGYICFYLFLESIRLKPLLLWARSWPRIGCQPGLWVTIDSLASFQGSLWALSASVAIPGHNSKPYTTPIRLSFFSFCPVPVTWAPRLDLWESNNLWWQLF